MQIGENNGTQLHCDKTQQYGRRHANEISVKKQKPMIYVTCIQTLNSQQPEKIG